MLTIIARIALPRCELLDEEMVRIVNSSNPDMSPWPEHTLLLYELTGERERNTERDRHREREPEVVAGKKGRVETGERLKGMKESGGRKWEKIVTREGSRLVSSGLREVKVNSVSRCPQIQVS